MVQTRLRISLSPNLPLPALPIPGKVSSMLPDKSVGLGLIPFTSTLSPCLPHHCARCGCRGGVWAGPSWQWSLGAPLAAESAHSMPACQASSLSTSSAQFLEAAAGTCTVHCQLGWGFHPQVCTNPIRSLCQGPRLRSQESQWVDKAQPHSRWGTEGGDTQSLPHPFPTTIEIF